MRKKAVIIVVSSVIVIAVVFITLAAYGNYRMSLIPQMSVEEILEYTLKESDSGIITIGTIKDGQTSYSVYGKNGVTLENDLHIYEIGSLTKTITASLISKAVCEGKIDIDSPVDKYI